MGSPVNKQKELYAILVERILRGKYPQGSRLPKALELAKELRTSYVTMVNVLKLLEKDGYLRVIRGKGSFVNARPSDAGRGCRIVNLVNFGAFGGYGPQTMDAMLQVITEAGWQYRFFTAEHSLVELREVLNDEDSYTIIGSRADFAGFAATMDHLKRRAIMMGNRSEMPGVACVTADEQQSIRLCMDFFLGQKLERIALILARSHDLLEQERASVWQSLLLDAGLPYDLLWKIELGPMEPERRPTRRLVEKLWQEGELQKAQAVIAPCSSVADELRIFLQEHGIRVPQDVQIISIGDTMLSQKGKQPISVIDNNLVGHVKMAIGIFENRMKGLSDAIRFYLCQPRLILRATTLQPNAPNQ